MYANYAGLCTRLRKLSSSMFGTDMFVLVALQVSYHVVVDWYVCIPTEF